MMCIPSEGPKPDRPTPVAPAWTVDDSRLAVFVDQHNEAMLGALVDEALEELAARRLCLLNLVAECAA